MHFLLLKPKKVKKCRKGNMSSTEDVSDCFLLEETQLMTHETIWGYILKKVYSKPSSYETGPSGSLPFNIGVLDT